jgi:hypothetical protein
MSIWTSIIEWCNRPTVPRTLEWVGPDYVRPKADPPPPAATADNCYLRISLVEMFLTDSRRWFRDYQPSVSSLVRLKFGDRTIDIPSIAASSAGTYAAGASVFSNARLCALVPFRGGEVGVEVALLALPGDDRLGNGLKALANVAGLIAAPVSAALAVASKVKESVEMVVGTSAEVHLAYHNTFTADAGAAQLRDGYLVVANVERGSLAGLQLVVENDQLKLWNGQVASSVAGIDYMLLRFQILGSRDDKGAFSDIEKTRDAALTAFISATSDSERAEAERLYRAAIAVITTHPELINADRRALAKELFTECEPYRRASPTERFAGSPPRSWDRFIDELEPSLDSAPVSLAEFGVT